MELFVGAPKKSQLTTKRPLYDEWKPTTFIKIPLDFDSGYNAYDNDVFERELRSRTFSNDTTEYSMYRSRNMDNNLNKSNYVKKSSIDSESTIKPSNGTSSNSLKKVPTITSNSTVTDSSNISIRNLPKYNFSVNSLTSIGTIYFSLPTPTTRPINTLVYVLMTDYEYITTKSNQKLIKLSSTVIDEDGFPIDVTMYEKDDNKSIECLLRKGDIIYIENTHIKLLIDESNKDGIPSPKLQGGKYTICYRLNVHKDADRKKYRPDWLATHKPNLRVLQLYEYIESNL